MSIRERFAVDPVYLMDGTAFVYRGFYANQSMQRSDGFPTGALYIVARLLLRILREEAPRHFVFVLDGPGPHFRHELFPLYKAQRKSTPDDLIRQLPPIRRLVEMLGLRLEVSEGCEADDCLASLAQRHSADGPVVIVGADKDLRQCLRDNVLLWDPAGRDEKIVTLESFTQETGLSPAQWADVQAVVGDSSDNIPGIPGVGPKTAAKIFQRFATLEDLRDHLDELAPTLRAKFEGHLDAMFLYRELTRLDTTRCTGLDKEALAVRAVNRQEAASLLREFELASLERELAALIRGGQVKSDEAVASRSSGQISLFDTPRATPRPLCRTADDLPSFAQAQVAVLEGLEPDADIALGMDGQEYLWAGPLDTLVTALEPAARLVTPDVKSLLRRHEAWRRLPVERWFDLGLATYLLDPDERDYSWPRLSARWGTALDLSPGNPALLALAIMQQLDQRLAGTHLGPLIRDLELPLIPVLADMENAGICLDATALNTFLSEVQRDLDTLTAKVYAEAGCTFNIRSAQQIGEVLFQHLKLPTGRKTRGGQASTNQDVLEKLSGQHPVVDALLEFRKLEKLRSTYLEPLPRLMGADGRIRTSFNQLATATGRLSSSNPNLQNIPVRGPLGRRMRSCFTAAPGLCLVAADYSQIELRVLAHFSADPTLLDAFREGADIHARTAGLLYDIAPEAVTSEQRRNAKTINFGLIYGMGATKLAAELGISLADARAFIARYFERLQGIKAFYEDVENLAKEQGYVTTLAGRRRLLPQIHSENTQEQALARRQAINTLIQGSAADIIKLAMLAVAQDAELAGLGARLLLQVHDELLLEVPEAAAEATGQRLAALMTTVQPGGQPLHVPITVDWGIGHDWGTAH